MSEHSPSAEGSCYCGALSVSVKAPLRPPINCHCGQCRRLSGAAFTTWLTLRRDEVAVAGHASLTTFAPTVNLVRHFCSVCGSHVYTTDTRLPKAMGLPAGLFADALVPTPSGEYFVDDKAPWHTVPAGATCFGGTTGTQRVGA